MTAQQDRRVTAFRPVSLTVGEPQFAPRDSLPMDIISNAGGAGSFSFDDSSSPSLPSSGRGRVRSADFGLPERTGLLDLARTYLETQARLWPELVGTAAVPAADAATIAAMADDFERRFRQQAADIFQPGAVPRMSGRTSASRTYGSVTRTPTRGRSTSSSSTS